MISLVPLGIFVLNWPQVKYNPARDKAAFLLLLAAVWGLAIALVFNPEMPGPTDLINFVFKPFGKLLQS